MTTQTKQSTINKQLNNNVNSSSNYKPAQNNSNTYTSQNHKWINQLRTLPSNPQSKDFLKLEYLEVNLNNSRKLITNLNNLKTESSDYVQNLEKIVELNGNLIQLNQVSNELKWLDSI